MTNIVSHTNTAFYSDAGRVDAIRLRDYLDITTEDIASIAGKSGRRVRQDPDAPTIQPALQSLVQIINGLAQLTNNDDRMIRIWLQAPHPALNQSSPMHLMQAGRIDSVKTLVEHMLSGAPA